MVAVALAAVLAACGGDASSDPSSSAPRIVVTTNILGDVVRNIVGPDADLEVIMPEGVDPHEFQASPKQAQAMRSADVLITNGLGMEEGLLDIISAAKDDGVDVFELGPLLDPKQANGHDDPHWFTDPSRMAKAAGLIAAHLHIRDPRATSYEQALEQLDRDVEQTLSVITPERRKLVTNHDSFTYFADRYGFEFVGAVIPSTSTEAQPSSSDLQALAEQIRAAGVPAIFAEASSTTRLADALAGEVGSDVKVVTLFTESLGAPGSGAETYIDLMHTDAARIAGALG